MENSADRPWMALARRPAPLADLFQSEYERMHDDRSQGDDEGPDEDERRVAPVATPPVPPAAVD